MHTILPDTAKKLVRIKLNAGTWEEAGVLAFYADLNRAIEQLRCRPGEHMILLDTRGSAVQPAGLIALGQSMFDRFPNKARRIAVVIVDAGLSRLQAKRLAVDPRCSLFESAADAEEWLTSEEFEPA